MIFEKRAATLIYNFLNSALIKGKFLIPSNVCHIIPMIFISSGVQFEFIDISEDTLCIDEALVDKRLENKTDPVTGLLFVHTYGVEASFNDFFKRLKEKNTNLIIIDDKCLCIPDLCIKEENLIADLTLFSTGAKKYIDLDFGGFAYFKGNYIRCQRLFQQKDLVIAEECLLNRGIINSDKLKKLQWIDFELPKISFKQYVKALENKYQSVRLHKQKINEIYENELPVNIKIDMQFNHWRYNILVKNKNLLLQKIFDSGLFASSHYKSLSQMFFDKESPVSDKLYSEVINLFNDFYFDENKAFKLTKIIKKSAF